VKYKPPLVLSLGLAAVLCLSGFVIVGQNDNQNTQNTNQTNANHSKKKKKSNQNTANENTGNTNNSNNMNLALIWCCIFARDESVRLKGAAGYQHA
jgi:hypothetical protein